MPNEKESELLRRIRLLYEYYMIKLGSGVAVSLPSLGGGGSESREKISSPRHTPVTPRSSRPVWKLSLLALGGHEAGNFSVARCESIPNHIAFAGSTST